MRGNNKQPHRAKGKNRVNGWRKINWSHQKQLDYWILITQKKKKRLLDTNEERKLNLEYPSSEPCGRAQVGVRLDLIEWGFWFTGPEKGEPW